MKRSLKYFMAMAIVAVLSVGMVVPRGLACEKKEGVRDHVLLFCSDVHEEAESSLVPLLMRYRETEILPDYICYGGDYAKVYNNDAIKGVMDSTKKIFPSASILMGKGNHDCKGYNRAEFLKITGQKDDQMVVREKGYCIYMLGASTENQEFLQEDLDRLKKFLDECEGIVPKIPIFIVSHYPLHYYKSGDKERKTKRAEEMIALLNQHSNVIFLYGHNHSLGDTNYETVFMPGDELEIEKDCYEGIHFPYTSMGAIKDGAKQDVYGLKVVIEHTMCCNKVIFEHVNEYAEPKDNMMICFPIV